VGVFFQVPDGYTAAVDLSRAAARAFGWLDSNTGANPVTIEAKKTVAFEVWEQLGRRLPDLMVAPVGDGPPWWRWTRASPSSSAVAWPPGGRA
jgi:threonine synthase